MLVAVSKPCGKKKHKIKKYQIITLSGRALGILHACMQAVQQQQLGPRSSDKRKREREREREREMLKAESSVESLKSSSKQSITHHRAKITLLGRSKEGILV
jgi:hypothetical protein